MLKEIGMLYLKDIETELTDIMFLINKNFNRCPSCRKAKVKRNSTISHMIDVAVTKIASTMIGGSVPAPDYRYTCPNCHDIFIRVNGKLVSLKKALK